MVRFFYVKYTKNVKFVSGSRVPHGPDLPWQKFQFQFSSHLPDDGGSISRNVAKKQHY